MTCPTLNEVLNNGALKRPRLWSVKEIFSLKFFFSAMLVLCQMLHLSRCQSCESYLISISFAVNIYSIFAESVFSELELLCAILMTV